jgi:hypothetical protein
LTYSAGTYTKIIKFNDGIRIQDMKFDIRVINDPPKASVLILPDINLSILELKTFTLDINDETPYQNLVYTLVSPLTISSFLTINKNVITISPPSTMKTTTYYSVTLSVSDGVNPAVNLNPFNVRV